MRRIIVLAVVLGLTGCSSKPPSMAGTPESSRATLVAALDGWKAGQTSKDLSSQSPPLYFVDDDLNRGTKLLDHRIEGEGKPVGTGYSYVVVLTLQDGAEGRTLTRKVAYTAVTEPKLAVTREDRKP
jgi:hypothetical protein